MRRLSLLLFGLLLGSVLAPSQAVCPNFRAIQSFQGNPIYLYTGPDAPRAIRARSIHRLIGPP